MKRQTMFSAGAGVFVAVAALIAFFWISGSPDASLGGLENEPRTPAATGTEVIYSLEEGKTSREIGQELQELGVIASAEQFEMFANLTGLWATIRASSYRLSTGMPAANVLEQITDDSDVPVIRVTFPEGIRVEEMAVIAEDAGFGLAQDFLEAAAFAPLPAGMEELLPPETSRQGFLFPDTYILPEGASVGQLVTLMFETFNMRYTPEMRDATAAAGLTPFQVVTLASIVEREAVVADERPIIASVYFNRLADGIKLDADPTVQFAVAENPASVTEYGWWKAELTIDDLANPSPYNTYVHAGYPPGPITNPGLAAIDAVIHPADTNFYYFVANGILDDGSHVFAETFEEHQENVAQYQP